MDNAKKPCFVIMPIGETDSDTRKRSDQVLKHIIRPAVDHCGYNAERADEMDKPGIITSQVIQRVVNDPLVVADLTDRNPNVFYELAIRHAIRKPLVQLIKKGERIPFDVAGTRTIQVDHHDLDSVEVAKSEMISQIKSLESDASTLETPISVSLDLQILRQSDKPEDRSLADLLATVSDLRASVGKIDGKVASVEDIQGGFKSIAARLDEALDSPTVRRRQRIQPRYMHEVARYVVNHKRRDIAILLYGSIFRDDFPLVYEVAVEAYRAMRDADSTRVAAALSELRELIDLTFRGPWAMDLVGRDRDLQFVIEELRPFLRELLES